MKVIVALFCIVGFAGGVAWAALHWVYSDGQRVGYVQSLARQGRACDTWEGEMAIVSAPGTVGEKFRFTVPSQDVAQGISAQAGKLIALHYQQHKWTVNSCFGDTQYFVTGFHPIS